MSPVLNFRKKRLQKMQIVPDILGLKIPSTFTYQFPEWESPEQLQTFLEERRRGELIGVEAFLSKDKQRLLWVSEEAETAFHSSSPIVLSRQKEDRKNMTLWTALPVKSSMFPFKMESFPIWETIRETLLPHLKEEQVLIQLLLKKRKHEKWKEQITLQYENYLQGIDEPSDFRPLFKLQQKLNQAFQEGDWGKVQMKPLPAVEMKCQEEGYHVCIRLAICGKEKEKREFLGEKILRAFRKMNDTNEWSFSKVLLHAEGFLDNMQFRRFPLLSGKHTTLCTKEIFPFVTTPPYVGEWSTGKKSSISITVLQDQAQDNKVQEMRTEPCAPSPLVSLYISLFPKDKSQSKLSFDSTIVKKLNEALKRLNLLKAESKLVFQSVVHAPTVQRVQFSFPTGLKLSQLQQSTKDIQTELGIDHMGFVQGKDAGTVTLLYPQPNRQVVYLREWLEKQAFAQFTKGKDLPFFIGVSEEGEPLFDCLTRVKHLLTAGTTGSGKSVWLNQLLLVLLMMKAPKDLLIYLIDPKMVEFSLYAKFPHVLEVLTEAEEAEQLLRALTIEMDKRYKILAQHGCRNIQQYNRKALKKMPYILTVVDEYADLKMMSDSVEDYVIRLAQKARACGIHLIIATQRPSVDVITGILKSNLPSRIVFACSSVHDYKTVLDEKPAMKLLGKGHGVAQLEGKQGLLPFQGAVISLDEEKTDEIILSLAQKLSQKYPKPAPPFEWRNGLHENKEEIKERQELSEHEDTVEKEQEVEPLEKLKTVIAETGETRVSKLREVLQIRQNVVNQMMQELVTQGWLQAPENKRKGYTLLLTEQERERYLQGKG